MAKREEGRGKREDRKKKKGFIFYFYFHLLLPSFFFFLSVVICPPDACATAVYLKSGKVMTGKIVEKNDQFIVLKSGAGRDIVRTTIFHEDILRIETEEEYAQQVALIPFKIFRLESKRIEIEEPFFTRVEIADNPAENIQKLIQQDIDMKSESLEDTGGIFWTAPGERSLADRQFKNKIGGRQGFQNTKTGVTPSEARPKVLSAAPADKPAVFSDDIELLDFYYRRLSREEEEFFLVVRNKGQKVIPLVYIDTEINGESFGDNQVKIEQLNPGEEREINIARVYKSYLGWYVKKYPESTPEKALRFRFSRPDDGEVLLEKVIVVFS